MVVVWNTFFWTFFFMIGFMATVQIVEDFGPSFMRRWFKVRTNAAVLIAVYIVVILLFIKTLRIFGTTFSWTANAIRNGTLVYIATRISNRRVFHIFLLVVFATFYPFWNFSLPATLGLAGTLVCLLPLNYYQRQLRAHFPLHLLFVMLASLIFWIFDMYFYHYRLGQTLMVTAAFVAVIFLTYGYDRLLDYRKRQTVELEYDNQHDALTGVRSLSKFNDEFMRYRTLAAEGTSSSVQLVMIDIDDFKAINDTYGHLTGNAVLQGFARDLDTFLEKNTIFPTGLYRTGGEEFSLMVTGGATKKDVRELMAAYMEHLHRLTLETDDAEIRLTVSIGIAQVLASDADNSDTIARADAHLYEAKQNGRNRVVAEYD